MFISKRKKHSSELNRKKIKIFVYLMEKISKRPWVYLEEIINETNIDSNTIIQVAKKIRLAIIPTERSILFLHPYFRHLGDGE